MLHLLLPKETTLNLERHPSLELVVIRSEKKIKCTNSDPGQDKVVDEEGSHILG